MRNLAHHFSQLCNRNRDNSEGTRDRRSHELALIARQLRDLGYVRGLNSVGKIKNRHIFALVKLWLEGSDGKHMLHNAAYTPVSVGAVKNRLASLRWALGKVGRENMMLTNDQYLVPRRTYVATESKAFTVTDEQLSDIDNEWVRYALKLQIAFGLRRESAIKFRVSKSYTPGSDYISLVPSTTKGGRPITIPITDDAQRVLLAEIAAFTGSGSLIPPSMKYIEHLRVYEREYLKAGIKKPHGLRHSYAQDRYAKLSGLTPPVLRDDEIVLTEEERRRDTAARLEVSEELGHSRESILASYVGTKRSKKA